MMWHRYQYWCPGDGFLGPSDQRCAVGVQQSDEANVNECPTITGRAITELQQPGTWYVHSANPPRKSLKLHSDARVNRIVHQFGTRGDDGKEMMTRYCHT